MTGSRDDLDVRLRAVERAVADLQEALTPPPGANRAPASDGETFWALTELERRTPGTVLMVGSVEVPDGGTVRWQYALTGDALRGTDWAELAGTLDALAHPARLSILQLVLNGVGTTAELLAQESVGTTGQLHHHLRQLVAAGWLTSTRRGHYAVPGPRVVPLLVTVLAARR